ncbi:MAG: TonB family protein [Verrucomicrobiota bacterium]|nr:TonB family protein [Verrucomicrobiota bacterium]
MKLFVLSLATFALGAAHLSAQGPTPAPSGSAKKKPQAQPADSAQTYAAAAGVASKRAPGLFRAETQSPPNAEQTPNTQSKKTIVSGGVLNGKAISKPQPAYPPTAKGSGASGTVKVEVVVDEKGRVASAKAISGHPKLRDAAAIVRSMRLSGTSQMIATTT